MKYLNKKQQENYIKNHLKGKGIKYEFVNNVFYIDNKLILSLQRVINSDNEVFIIYPWNDIEKFVEMVDYRLNLKTTKRIYARNTEIRIENISKKHRDFLNENHILDSPPVRNKICSVCLYYKNELVGLGVFNKYNDGAELKRLVFKKGVSVVGGASKIIKHFHLNYKNYKNLYTFSDNNLGDGNVYDVLGFSLVDNVEEQIIWYNPEFKKNLLMFL